MENNAQINQTVYNNGIVGFQGENNIVENYSGVRFQIASAAESENNFQQQIHQLNKRMDELSNWKIPKWVYWVWIMVIIALGFSIAALSIRVSYKWNVELLSTGLIFTFVGILATFVVVSNYSQVKDIQRDFDKKVKKIKDKFGEKIIENNKDTSNYAIAYSCLLTARTQRDLSNNDIKFPFYYYQQTITYYSLVKNIDTSFANRILDEMFRLINEQDPFTILINKMEFDNFYTGLSVLKNLTHNSHIDYIESFTQKVFVASTKQQTK